MRTEHRLGRLGRLRYTSATAPEEPAIRLVSETNTSYIYENTQAYPRSWLVHTVHPVVDQAGAVQFFEGVGRRDSGGAIEIDDFDPSMEAVVEVGSDGPPDDVRRLLPSAAECRSTSEDHVVIVRYEASSVKIQVDTDCPGLLVLSDT